MHYEFSHVNFSKKIIKKIENSIIDSINYLIWHKLMFSQRKISPKIIIRPFGQNDAVICWFEFRMTTKPGPLVLRGSAQTRFSGVIPELKFRRPSFQHRPKIKKNKITQILRISKLKKILELTHWSKVIYSVNLPIS